MQFRSVLVVAASLIPTPAIAADVFVIGGSGIAETRAVTFANARGEFARVGVSVREVISGDTKVGPLLGASGDTGLHAHTYASTAIADMNAGRVCSKLVAPLVIRYPSAIIGKVSRAADLKGAEIGFYALQSVAGSAVRHWLREKGIGDGAYVPRQLNVFSGKRVEHLHREANLKAIHVAEPHASYLAHAAGLTVLSRIGDPAIPPVVASGLFVHCAHLDDPVKRAVVAKVVSVLKRHMTTPIARNERQAWIASMLAADHDKRVRDGIGGFVLPPVALADIARSIDEHDAALMPGSEWPSEAVELTVKWAIYPETPKKAFSEFVDRTLWDAAR